MIDWARAIELHDEVGAEDFSEILELFLSEVEEILARVGDNLDPKDMCADLHTLKGSALNLGFSELAELCGTGEKLANSGSLDGIDTVAIVGSYERSKSVFLKDYTARLAA